MLPRSDLHVIASELRTLPQRGDSPAERLESAGRLLRKAIDLGAFASPNYTAFVALVMQRFEQPNVNGPISGWAEAVWWLRGKPDAPPDTESSFAEDCELIADLLEKAAHNNRQGTDDRRLAWRYSVALAVVIEVIVVRLAWRYGEGLNLFQKLTSAQWWLGLGPCSVPISYKVFMAIRGLARLLKKWWKRKADRS